MPMGLFDFYTREKPPASTDLADAYHPYIETCIAAFGVDRSMFESNFPPDGASSSYPILWNAFKRLAAGYSPSENALLLGRTPKRVYRLARFALKYDCPSSVIGFTIGSALCGAATSLGEPVLFRALQGVAGAGLIPLSQATLLQINPPERHGHAMAVFGIGTILGPIMGPTLGGWVTQDYSWRWIFFINLPVGALCTLGILIFIRHTRNVHRAPFEFVGVLTLSLGVGALQLMLDRGELKDWFHSSEIWVEATIAGLGFYLFTVHTATTDDRSPRP